MDKPTSEQSQIINFQDNTVVIAGPGSGKTYTIVQKIIKILDNIEDYQGVIAISYTRKAAEELKKRVKKINVSDANSFFGTIDSFILSDIIYKFSTQFTGSSVDYEIITIEKLIKIDDKYKWLSNLTIDNLNKNTINIEALLSDGYIPLEIITEIGLFIMENVSQCKKYFLAKYTHIIIDEYQDCDIAKHKFFSILVEWGLIGIAVGDPNQSIYAFSQKYSKYLMKLEKLQSFKTFELTINHRSHHSIINFSDLIIDRPLSFPEEEIDRIFLSKTSGDEKDLLNMIYYEIELIKRKYKILDKDIAFLCRSGHTAERLHRHWKGKSKLLTRTKFSTQNTSNSSLIDDLVRVLLNHQDEKIAVVDVMEFFYIENNFRNTKLIHNFLESGNLEIEKIIEYINEMCLLVSQKGLQENEIRLLKDILTDEDELLKYTETADDEINIITIHSSKGMEFDCVFIFDMYQWVISDNRFSNMREERYKEYVEQNWNLFYVAVSRAKEVVFIMNGDIRYNAGGKIRDASPSNFLTTSRISNRIITLKDSLGMG